MHQFICINMNQQNLMIHQLPKNVPRISVLVVWTATGKMKRFVIKRTLHVKTVKILGTIISNHQEFQRIPAQWLCNSIYVWIKQ